MDLLDAVGPGAVIGLDTAPIIYFLEAHPVYGPMVLPLFAERLEQGLNLGVTSVISLAEVLVKPLGAGRDDLVARYRELLTGAPHLSVAPVTLALAERAARLRARHRIRLPDAIQLAAALEHGATLFVTNDIRLRAVTDLHVLILDDYVAGPPPRD